jgi:hypothetical protein
MLRSNWMRPAARMLAAAAAAALLLSSAPAGAKSLKPDPVPDAWQRPHADGANTGYANVKTQAAAKPAITIPNLGTIAPGAGPVIGPDGTVYIGNMQGKLMAFHADGRKAWSRQLDAGQQILASPVVNADGAIFVVSQSMFTDNRVNPPFTRPDSTLHKFLPGGGYAFKVAFPENGAKLAVPNGTGGTSAAPNIWRFNGAEAVMVPVIYTSHVAPGREVRLIAFSTEAPAVIGDARVSTFVQRTTGSCPGCEDRFLWIFPGMGFQGHGMPEDIDPSTLLPRDIKAPLPPAAIYTFPGGGTPWIVVSDNLWDIVGFTFSPQQGFFEGYRAHDESWRLIGAPMVMPDTETFVTGPTGIVTWRGQALQQRGRIDARSGAGPTRTATDKIVFASISSIGVKQGNGIGMEQALPGQTMVSPAASQNNLFVSTASAFVTFDEATMQPVARFDWRGGGTSPPAIGPYGDVYAIAGGTLHVFSAPLCTGCPGGLGQPLGVSHPGIGATTNPAPTPDAPGGTTTPMQSRYENPQGPTGKRLYACTEIGGDSCGKKVANSFCQARGWAKADRFDTDSKKVQAETLAGETCTKNKCKIFDFIDCEN